MLETREKSLIQADEKNQTQEQQLIEQNVKIEELQKALKVGISVIVNVNLKTDGWVQHYLKCLYKV